MLQSPAATGFGDWQMIHHNWEASYIAISRFGEWPLWDPFHCGGVPILGNPESQLYAPWFWLSFAFGTVLAAKLMLLGHIACATSGMYWLARCRYQLHPGAAAVAAVAWSCNGCFVWDGAGGHATFLSFAFAPWLSYFVHRNSNLLRDAAAVATFLILCLFEGGTYPLPFFALWIGFELSLRAAQRKELCPSLGFGAISFGLLAVCGAIRFVPIYFTLQAHPRQVPNRDVLSFSDLWTMLTARTHSWRMPGHPFVWPEYASYVGVAVVTLAMLGAVAVVRRKRWHLLLASLVYAALMFGNLSDFAPYSLLHRLPVYDSLRVPSRFAIFVTFYIALLAAHSLDFCVRRIRNERVVLTMSVVCVLGIGADLISASWPTVELWREPPLSAAAPAPAFYLLPGKQYASYASYPRLNVGTTNCYVGGMNWPISPALWRGHEPQVRLPLDTGELHDWQSSPNGYRARLTAREPTRVLFNRNFARGYESNLGIPVDDQGLLALDVPAGDHTITVHYSPPELIPSAAISCIGLVVLLGLLLVPSDRLRLVATRRR
ncbi:MAG TPA: hypothetical protein VFN67_33145 [Polyangiales bacterium]|nr:hypothetical protein [Polyangiales bacterium]